MSTTTHPDPSAEGLETIDETLTKLDPEIRDLAKHWSRDCPDTWEDLAQEVRLAVYQKLKEQPDSPHNHLFQVAKRTIVDYRRKGKSVDGRLYKTFKRQFVWLLVSLDAPDAVVADRSNLYFKPHQLRPVEDLAVTLVAYEELKGRLTEQQGRYLSLKLQGFKCREADRLLGVIRQQGERLRREIKEEAGNVLERVL